MTVKRYHEMGVTSCTATVLDCKALNDGNFDILLDETAIYPERHRLYRFSTRAACAR